MARFQHPQGPYVQQGAAAPASAAQQAQWEQEHLEWQQREANYREQLERHYWAQQEAEFQQKVAEYYAAYAARQQHQEQQHRLNQVLYGGAMAGCQDRHAAAAGGPLQQPAAIQQQAAHAAAQHQQTQHQQSQEGMDCCMQLCSPRPPLTAVSNFAWGASAAAPAWPGSVSGGMVWDGSAVGASGPRKRGQEAAALGEPASWGGPDTAFKRRAFRRD